MSKKLLVMLTILCMVCSSIFMLSGCSGSKSSDKDADPENVLESVRPPEGFVLYGSWVDEKNDDISMEITETGDDEYEVTILQRSGKDKNTQWEFSGKFDREGGLLSYEDCIKTEHVFDEDGNDNDTTVYQDGKGALLYLNEGLYWEDKNEDAGKDCSFKWLGETVDG